MTVHGTSEAMAGSVGEKLAECAVKGSVAPRENLGATMFAYVFGPCRTHIWYGIEPTWLRELHMNTHIITNLNINLNLTHNPNAYLDINTI